MVAAFCLLQACSPDESGSPPAPPQASPEAADVRYVIVAASPSGAIVARLPADGGAGAVVSGYDRRGGRVWTTPGYQWVAAGRLPSAALADVLGAPGGAPISRLTVRAATGQARMVASNGVALQPVSYGGGRLVYVSSTGGRIIVTASSSRGEKSVDTGARAPLVSAVGSENGGRVAVVTQQGSDGTYRTTWLTVGTDGQPRVTGKERSRHHVLTISPDGRHAVLLAEHPTLVDLSTGRRRSLPLPHSSSASFGGGRVFVSMSYLGGGEPRSVVKLMTLRGRVLWTRTVRGVDRFNVDPELTCVAYVDRRGTARVTRFSDGESRACGSGYDQIALTGRHTLLAVTHAGRVVRLRSPL